MRALKGLLIYIGIVLGMILGLGIILFAAMYFFPNFRIMGFRVVKDNEIIKGTPIVLSEYSDYQDIELSVNSKKLPINIQGAKEGQDITYSLDLGVFGLAYDITEYQVVKNVDVENGVLKITLNVTEPDGMVSVHSEGLFVSVPSSIIPALNLKSESGDISVYGFNISNLTINTKSGGVGLSQMGQLSEDKYKLTLDSLNLTTNSGKFNFSAINNIEVNNPVKLMGNNGEFQFNNLNASVDVTGSGLKLIANEINSKNKGFKFISDNGYFKINKLASINGTENTIVTENCDVNIGEITGKTWIETIYGNINVGTFKDYTILESDHGNIKVTKACEDIKVRTDFGNILVREYLKSGSFASRKGNIEVYAVGDYAKGVYTQIENVDGNIKVENKVNKLILKTTGRSNVDVSFFEIKGQLAPEDVFLHKVDLHSSGSAHVKIQNKGSVAFKFVAKGNISGEIAGFLSSPDNFKVQSSDLPQYCPNTDQAKIDSQKSCHFEFLGKIVFESIFNKN